MKPPSPLLGALPLCCCLLSTPATGADIFRYVDSDGNVHYTNTPADSRYKVHRRLQQDDPVTQAFTAKPRPRTRPAQGRYARQIETAGRAHNVDPALIHAVIAAESGYDPLARSRAGAAGLMQLMPETARRFGARNRLDPTQNIQAGTRYLRMLMNLFDNDLELVLAAYNAGENAVIRAGRRVPPYPETRSYVPRVLEYYQTYRTRM